MFKKISVMALILVTLFTFQLSVFAVSTEKIEVPPKPTLGIESSNPSFGSSKDIIFALPQVGGMLSDWYCTISNSGPSLALYGSQTTIVISDSQTLTLYLQRWDGAQWVDIYSKSVSNYNSIGITNSASYSNFVKGYYYRTRAVHTAIDGGQTDTQESASTYIYVS